MVRTNNKKEYSILPILDIENDNLDLLTIDWLDLNIENWLNASPKKISHDIDYKYGVKI